MYTLAVNLCSFYTIFQHIFHCCWKILLQIRQAINPSKNDNYLPACCVKKNTTLCQVFLCLGGRGEVINFNRFVVEMLLLYRLEKSHETLLFPFVIKHLIIINYKRIDERYVCRRAYRSLNSDLVRTSSHALPVESLNRE